VLAETLRVNMALLGQTRIALAGQDDQKSGYSSISRARPSTSAWLQLLRRFQQMQATWHEKAAMNRTWAKREKQIETIVSSTARFTVIAGLYGSSLLSCCNSTCPVNRGIATAIEKSN